jgi:hypothetical protein
MTRILSLLNEHWTSIEIVDSNWFEILTFSASPKSQFDYPGGGPLIYTASLANRKPLFLNEFPTLPLVVRWHGWARDHIPF